MVTHVGEHMSGKGGQPLLLLDRNVPEEEEVADVIEDDDDHVEFLDWADVKSEI